jgi:hypothetical protein
VSACLFRHIGPFGCSCALALHKLQASRAQAAADGIGQARVFDSCSSTVGSTAMWICRYEIDGTALARKGEQQVEG